MNDLQKLMVTLLTCADARIAMEAQGRTPEHEVVDGKDTGRIAHTVGEDKVTIHFHGGPTESVVFKGNYVDGPYVGPWSLEAYFG